MIPRKKPLNPNLYNIAFGQGPGQISRDELYKRLLRQESGNKQFNPDGSVVTSSAGARGAAQLMMPTAIDPGFGVNNIYTTAKGLNVPYNEESIEPGLDAVKKAQQNNALNLNQIYKDYPEFYNETKKLMDNEEVNRTLGYNYFNAQVDRYGNPVKALMSYNMGAGNTDNFNPETDILNDETRNYITKILDGVIDEQETTPSNNQGAVANPFFDPINQGRINVNLSNDVNVVDKPDINTSYTQGGFGITGNSKSARERRRNRTVAKRVNKMEDVRNVFDAKAGIPYSGQRDYSPGLTEDVPGQDDVDDTIYDIQNEDGTYTQYAIPSNIKEEDIPDYIESNKGKSKAGMFANTSETTNAEVVNADKDLFNFDTAVGRRNYNLGLDPDNAGAVDAGAVDAEVKKNRLGNLLTPQAFGAEDSRLSKLNELIDSDYMPKGRDNKKYLMGLVGSILADRYGDPTVDTNNFGQFLENTQTQDLQDRQAFEKRRDEAIALRDSLRADKNMVAGTLGIYRVDTPEGPKNVGGYYRVDGTFVRTPEMSMGGDMGEVGITSSGGKKVKYTGADGVERDGFEVKVNNEKLIIDADHAQEYFKDRNFVEEIQKHEQFTDKFITQDKFTQKLLDYARDENGNKLSDDEIRKSFEGIIGPVVGKGNETLITMLQAFFGKAGKTSEIFSALKSFKSGDYSIAYDTLKGAGQITEFEAATVAASYNMVNRALDPVTFIKALEEHRQNMIRLSNNQKARLGIVGYKVDTGFAKSDWQPSSKVNYETITNISDYES